MWYRMLIGLVCLMFFAQSGRADELVLKNGDRLTGKIVHLVDGKLVFKSDVAGEVTVELSNIQTFSSAEPVTVNLKDNTGFKQKVISAEAAPVADVRGDLEAVKAKNSATVSIFLD